MDMEYLLHSAVLATVGTMYTIFVAVSVFSAKYFDQDLKLMKQLLFFFLLLSVVVSITIFYNGFILYLQSSGTYGNSTVIKYEDFLYWSWTTFFLSTMSIIVFSYSLLSSVLAQICSFKLKKLAVKLDRLQKEGIDLLPSFDIRDEGMAKLKKNFILLPKRSENLLLTLKKN